MRVPRSRIAALLAASAAALAAALAASQWWRGREGRHLERAERLIERGSPEEALPWLELPSRSPGTRPRALLLAARAAVERGRPSDAVGPLDQIDPDGPLAADVAFWKGRTLLAAGQALRAAAWLRESLGRRPGDAEALRWLAAASYELGDMSSAVEALEQLARGSPGDAAAWRTMGLIRKEQAEFEMARDAYDASLRADGDQPAVRMELAEVLMELGRHGEAIGLLEACRGRVDEPARAERIARCRYEVGQLGPAREELELALVRSPDHPGLLAERARIDVAEGRAAEALAALDRAVAAGPPDADRLYLRSQALRRLGRAEEADRDLARSREVNELREAVSDLIRAADRSPGNAEVRYRIGALCARLDDPRMAASWFRAALACDPGHDAALRALAGLGRP